MLDKVMALYGVEGRIAVDYEYGEILTHEKALYMIDQCFTFADAEVMHFAEEIGVTAEYISSISRVVNANIFEIPVTAAFSPQKKIQRDTVAVTIVNLCNHIKEHIFELSSFSEEQLKDYIEFTLPTAILLDVPAYNQRNLGYPTGCEMVATAMMIAYEHDINIHEFANTIPTNTNPYYGFRGNFKTTGGFSIMPKALVAPTAAYIPTAYDMSYCSTDDLIHQLGTGKPVVVLVNGLGWNVHAVCLTGYNENGFFYNDPWTGQKDAFIKYPAFNVIWNKAIYDKIYGKYYTETKALSY